ncbi:MAG: HAMP domain-containing sensor histidine kinase [Planctomycetota bacterium]
MKSGNDQTENPAARLARQAEELKQRLIADLGEEILSPVDGFHALARTGGEQDARGEDLEKLASKAESAMRSLAEFAPLLIETDREVSEPENLELVLSRVVSYFKARASRLGIELVLESSCDSDLELDAPRLGRILAHLIDNALRYTPIGRVSVRSTLENKRLQIAVTDTGKGIRGEELESIFRPYVRGRDEDAKSAGGGLGLSLSRHYARALGGDLSVESSPGNGSTFTVSLPVPVRERSELCAE